jgi:hypothetical protein
MYRELVLNIDVSATTMLDVKTLHELSIRQKTLIGRI